MKWMVTIGGKKSLADPGLHVFSTKGLEKWSKMDMSAESRHASHLKHEWAIRPELGEQGENTKGDAHGLTMIHVDD